MSEIENSGDKTLTPPTSKTLHLKPRAVEQGLVRQSFSHGRSKVVVVEKVKRRAPGSGPEAKAQPSPRRAAAPPPPSTPSPSAKSERSAAPARNASPVVLTRAYGPGFQSRSRALSDARSREEEDRRRAEQERIAREAREAREREERAQADLRQREEAERLAASTKPSTEPRRKPAGGCDRRAGRRGRPAPAESATTTTRPRSRSALRRPPPPCPRAVSSRRLCRFRAPRRPVDPARIAAV